MTRPTTEELNITLQQLVETHNKALQTQKESREAIIAIQAVLKDRELENGNTNISAPESSEVGENDTGDSDS